jgi:RNA polymerase sigma-70 factor (ECF subfamily)
MRKSDLQKAPDEALIKASARGDQKAFAALVERYADTVYKFSFKVCRDKEKADETLQDTLINVYRKLDSFDGKSKFSTWLYTIVANNCLMKRRRTRARELTESLETYDAPQHPRGGQNAHNVAHTGSTPADILLHKELQSVLQEAITRLPVEYRAVFVLRDVEGKSTPETATILNLSVEATKSRLRRARAFLRDHLEPYVASEGRHP